MTKQTQFVACKFRIADNRTFTYANDGEPVQPGDVVRVPDRSGEGWKKVYVVEVGHEAPSFECKQIIGLHTDDEPTPLEAAAPADDHHPNSAVALLRERG